MITDNPHNITTAHVGSYADTDNTTENVIKHENNPF